MYQSRCLTILLCWTICRSYSQPFDVKMNSNDTNKTRIFSPRMDYDEWTPLGRGDPLKNDPTFDYVPPVLDRVQYWLDTQSSTEASSKRDILILGVTAKKTSPKIPDHYMKFGDSQKLTRIQESQDNYRNDFTGSTGAEPPKLVRATKFRPNLNGNSIDFRSQNRMQSLPASYYPSPYYTDKPKPYTMMMPPPITHKSKINQQFGSLNDQVTVAFRPGHLRIPQKNPLSTSIAFDKSNLIYQSSQTIDPWTANLDSSSSSINTWMSNEKFDDHYDHHASASSNHQVIVGQNANIIVDDSQKNEQVVVGKKEIVPTDDSNLLFDNKTVTPAHVVMANTSSSSNDDQSRVTVTVVMPTNYKPNNTEKTNVETSTVSFTTPTLPTTTPTTSTPIQTTRIPWRPPKIPPKAFPRRPGLSEISMPLQSIANQDMPQMSLQKLPSVLMQAPNSANPGSMFNTDIKKPPGKSPLASILNSQYNKIPSKIEIPKSTTEWLTSTTESPIITSTSEYTSDSVSLDDKQQPVVTTIHKPMYLIIQGHSKVKTYKPTVMKHSLPVDDNNDNIVESTMKKRMTTTTSRSISKFEQFVNDNTRVAPTTLPPNTDNHEVKAAKEKRVEHDSLLSLVESGFSALTAPPIPFDSSTIDQDNSDSTYDDDDDDLMIN
ncbi:uncharacterized protein LOC103573628 [Microplitis demolitor]|uniref:uncharacterized protein LOC103573628 n=1 Tax=Microplitis demolitor TaxID=69319 RepID=UPI0004CD394D|nr:uncharacterized protein LOC103573628 [Microplitis demolitor]XP_008551010.1 uncharacterized protein LOC103573628 [Microplitis demolitor]